MARLICLDEDTPSRRERLLERSLRLLPRAAQVFVSSRMLRRVRSRAATACGRGATDETTRRTGTTARSDDAERGFGATVHRADHGRAGSQVTVPRRRLATRRSQSRSRRACSGRGRAARPRPRGTARASAARRGAVARAACRAARGSPIDGNVVVSIKGSTVAGGRYVFSLSRFIITSSPSPPRSAAPLL